MKILIVAMLYDYGIPERGLSYEHYNFYLALRPLFDVSFFDFMGSFQKNGKSGMNAELLETIRQTKPDVVFFVPYEDELLPATIAAINTSSRTIGYFYDTAWRTSYSNFWAKHFNWVTTPDVWGIRRFTATGVHNAIYSPFGCNHLLFKKEELPKIYDVSFVGLYHPRRAWLIKKLRKAGLNVHVRGTGWAAGHASQEEMIRIFNQSRVNLNLSNSSSWDLPYLLSSPRAFANTLRASKNREQLKGRHFEINSCGAFQLSYYVEGLESCYRIGDEIAIFQDPDDLVEKAIYYVNHDQERERIASAGQEKTLREHTFQMRFQSILDQVTASPKRAHSR